ncbi:MAG: putative peptide modification system cyclase [Lysobacter sp.]
MSPSTHANDRSATFEPSVTSGKVPQLRTVLMTDLADSTALVEHLGDGTAAELFRAHDGLVLQLQQLWRGRLIDRSDGMLLLFERPIDGLGFVLDYHRGLAEIGAAYGVQPQARAGMHVGEVLIWRNSDAAVQVGAKAVEVEGLAKQMAARLMTMARPGQTLLSAVAEPLAHRASRELGERGQHLLWKSHGRWCFKGMPQTQEVYEVGEPGFAPLRSPRRSRKVWRDIPLWRRPAALVAQCALVLALAVGAWFASRPQPALAFHERDWVVLADLRNLTGQSLLDDSLQQAFRISLEQSRHVNVLSDLRTRDTLVRMQREPGTRLDRAIASEIAIRDGARAVILPTVAEVGGRVRISAEVIDPHNQTTVYAEYADGKGAASALASIDEVAAALREKLGEALEVVQRDSTPLPQVTTQSLDALRAYALGHGAFGRGEWREALELYGRAVKIDPKFALAHLAMSRVYVALSNRPAALPSLDKALALKERLPPRDRLYLDAWEAELRIPGQVLPRWKLLASMYPDYIPGQANAAWYLYVLNDFDAAREFADAANVPQVASLENIIDLIGRTQLANGKTRDAIANFNRAEAMQPGVSQRRLAAALAIQEQHTRASALVDSMPRSGFSSDDPVRYIDLVTFAADQARWAEAIALLKTARTQAGSESSFLAREFALIAASVTLVYGPGQLSEADFMALAKTELTALERPSNAKAADDAFMALVAAYFAQRSGYSSVATRVLEALERWERPLAGTVFEKMAVVVRAENERLSGHPEAAIRRLQGELDGTELVQARVAMHAALVAAGRHGEALAHAEWLLSHRGRAYMEANAAQVLQTLNVLDTRLAHLYAAEAMTALEKAEPAGQRVEALLTVWPRDRLPAYLERKVDVILPASKQKMTW